MARLRLPLGALAPGVVALDADASRYVARVHRLGVGAMLVAFDPERSLEAEAEVLSAGPPVTLRIGPLRRASALPARRVTVVQTASKGSKIDDVLRDATELGATRFVVAVGSRSVKRPDSSQQIRWRKVATEAARQCGRGDVPTIEGPLPLLAALAEPGARRWLLDPGGEPLSGVAAGGLPPAGDDATVVVVGPEGGFAPEEIDAACRAGFVPVRLGRFVLRTETACAAVLGALALLDDEG